MKINFSKFRSAKSSVFNRLYSSMCKSERIVCKKLGILHPPQGGNAQLDPFSSHGTLTKVTPAECVTMAGSEHPEVKVVGCHIEDGSATFEDHEIAMIVRHILALYSEDVHSIIRHRMSYDTTVVVDVYIDHFSCVDKVKVLHPILPENDSFTDDVNNLMATWTFPTILRKGRCRVVFSEKF